MGGEGRKNEAAGDREEITAAQSAPPGWGWGSRGEKRDMFVPDTPA